MPSIEITTVARRIARAHNQACGGSLSGGQLVFDTDGNGGEWYSSHSYGFGAGTTAYPVGHRPVTAGDVQEFLDARSASE